MSERSSNQPNPWPVGEAVVFNGVLIGVMDPQMASDSLRPADRARALELLLNSPAARRRRADLVIGLLEDAGLDAPTCRQAWQAVHDAEVKVKASRT